MCRRWNWITALGTGSGNGGREAYQRRAGAGGFERWNLIPIGSQAPRQVRVAAPPRDRARRRLRYGAPVRLLG
ncbi:hypothetical protein GCM10009090_30300 [[Pseudomonas] boreopolis]|uniref:Uncharacterized protein n=1 Tax=Xanthomonas boreopolis TaxID=86183 RepID=A0A919FA65_9XANT|nr:hypothetical protein GCM10009090_30300 [[Pseudomonas] boreopolis]